MREFYLFKINNQYKKLTISNPYNLYMILSGIRKSNILDITYAYSLFDSINELIDKDKILSVLKAYKDNITVYNNIYSYNDYYSNEQTRIFIHKSYIKLITNKDNPIILKKLSKIKNLFVVDFINKEYYYLVSMENKVIV